MAGSAETPRRKMGRRTKALLPTRHLRGLFVGWESFGFGAVRQSCGVLRILGTFEKNDLAVWVLALVATVPSADAYGAAAGALVVSEPQPPNAGDAPRAAAGRAHLASGEAVRVVYRASALTRRADRRFSAVA